MRTLKETFLFTVQPRQVIILIVTILIIVTVLVFVFYPTSLNPIHLAENILFTAILSYTSFFMVLWFRAVERETLLQRVAYSYLSLTISAFTGTTLGTVIILTITPDAEPPHPFWILYLSNWLITLIAGTTLNVYSYYMLKLEKMAHELAEKEINEQRILSSQAKARVESLRARVNPHFLFNTLNSISSLVYTNPELAEEMIQKLANLFRFSLDYEGDAVIELSRELQIVRNYLDIEKVRLNDQLQYEIRVEPTVTSMKIPPFLIQPLVENSIKHGLSKKSGGGTILVDVTKSGDQCVIRVEDSGPGFKNGTGLNGRFGLRGISDRIDLHYGEKATLQILDGPGAIVQLTIPAHQ